MAGVFPTPLDKTWALVVSPIPLTSLWKYRVVILSPPPCGVRNPSNTRPKLRRTWMFDTGRTANSPYSIASHKILTQSQVLTISFQILQVHVHIDNYSA